MTDAERPLWRDPLLWLMVAYGLVTMGYATTEAGVLNQPLPDIVVTLGRRFLQGAVTVALVGLPIRWIMGRLRRKRHDRSAPGNEETSANNEPIG